MEDNTMIMNEDELELVSGGTELFPTNYEKQLCEEALSKVDGKTCKYCKKVYSKEAVKQHYSADMRLLYSRFVHFGRKAVPCITCGYWRYYNSDFE